MSIISPSMSSAALLLAWDAKRTAERKPGFSMSALGTCRRRAGYLLANTPPTNASGSVQAAMGSAAHEKIAEAARELFPDDLIEFEVTFAGILGHGDRYDAEHQEVVDTKTTSSRWLAHVILNGPEYGHIWQVSAYAAALIQQGKPVKTVALHYLARDTGEEHIWRKLFDPRDVRDALQWLKIIRDTPLEMLPRDHEPDSGWCRSCPFLDICWEGMMPDRSPLSVLYVEDPDAEKWAEELWHARADEKAAKARAKRAAGALDALRPDDGGRVQVGTRTLDFRSNGLYFVAGGSRQPAVGYEDGQP